MNLEPAASRQAGCPLHVVCAQGTAITAVVGVFKHQQPAAGKVDIIGAHRRFDVLQVNGAVRSVGHRARVNPADGRRSALFVVKNMGLVPENHLVAPAAVNQLTDQVGHGAAGHQQGRRFARPFGRHFLQAFHGGVFAINVVSDFGFGHGFSHPLGGRGDGVAAQIDEHF